MPAVPADLSIEPRWIVPMTRRDEILEHHALVMRDGRILDVLPSALAADRYAPRVVLDRPAHVLMPGLVNARTRIGSLEHAAALPQFLPEIGTAVGSQARSNRGSTDPPIYLRSGATIGFFGRA